MNALKFCYTFQFDNQFIFNQEIDFVAAIKTYAFVVHRNRMLFFEIYFIYMQHAAHGQGIVHRSIRATPGRGSCELLLHILLLCGIVHRTAFCYHEEHEEHEETDVERTQDDLIRSLMLHYNL